ncbi:hypothetical protein PG990_013851 [Apiospora arundinis]
MDFHIISKREDGGSSNYYWGIIIGVACLFGVAGYAFWRNYKRESKGTHDQEAGTSSYPQHGSSNARQQSSELSIPEHPWPYEGQNSAGIGQATQNTSSPGDGRNPGNRQADPLWHEQQTQGGNDFGSTTTTAHHVQYQHKSNTGTHGMDHWAGGSQYASHGSSHFYQQGTTGQAIPNLPEPISPVSSGGSLSEDEPSSARPVSDISITAPAQHQPPCHTQT